LPTITEPMLIDGTTQPGYDGKPLIEINGSSLPTSTDGLLIEAGGSTVWPLIVARGMRSG
jgi:hypothetical protein